MKRQSTLRARIRPTRFGAMLRLYRTVADRDLRDMAAEIGIGHATLMRIEHGEALDMATFLKLCDWMFAPPVAQEGPPECRK